MKSLLQKLKDLGWIYEERRYENGIIYAYIFRHEDCDIEGAYWEVSIEDHHNDGDWNDWLIFTRYHDPNQKDWEGHQIDTSCCVEYKAMLLIMKVLAILDSHRRWVNR